MTHRWRAVLLLPALVLLAGCPTSESQAAIRSVRVGDAPTVLAITVDSCHQAPEVSVAETGTEVRLTVTVHGDSAGDCHDGTSADLDAPLGDRTVVDAATGKELRVEGR